MMQAMLTDRHEQTQGATKEKRYSEGMCTNCVQKRRHLENVVCMYWKTTDFKDDFVQSKDDIYISRIGFLEDAESKDDFNL